MTLGLVMSFNTTPNANPQKRKTDNMSFLKLELLLCERPCSETKRQATNWEEIFAKHISGKRSVFKIYKKLSELNNKETNIRTDNG